MQARHVFARRSRTAVLVLGLLVCLQYAPAAAGEKPEARPLARNVIVMIVDGWGFPHLSASSYYQHGRDAAQSYNRWPFRMAMTTYMAYGSSSSCHGWGYDPLLAWSSFGYVKSCATDSAAAATAMATGVKTYNGAIGVGMDRQPLANVVEAAESLGKRTGVVTSVPFSHATAAGFVAHNPSRGDYGGIAREMIGESAVDVIMGTGHPRYNNNGDERLLPTYGYVGGAATWADLVAGTAGGDADGDGLSDPWQLVEDRDAFDALAYGPAPSRVLGVPRVYDTLQQRRAGDGHAAPFVVPGIATVPTLADMTAAALNVLDDDPDGFFLMVEGGAVDWASHANQSGRMIEESIDFDASVEVVEAWVRRHSNWGETLVIVTGDHETGYLTGPGSNPTWESIVNNGAGNVPGMQWNSTGHTNGLMFLAAKGDAGRLLRSRATGRDPVYGPYADNTDVAHVVFEAMGRR